MYNCTIVHICKSGKANLRIYRFLRIFLGEVNFLIRIVNIGLRTIKQKRSAYGHKLKAFLHESTFEAIEKKIQKINSNKKFFG